MGFGCRPFRSLRMITWISKQAQPEPSGSQCILWRAGIVNLFSWVPLSPSWLLCFTTVELSSLLSKPTPTKGHTCILSLAWVGSGFPQPDCTLFFTHIDLMPESLLFQELWGAAHGGGGWVQISLLHCFPPILHCCRNLLRSAGSPDPTLLWSNVQFGSDSILQWSNLDVTEACESGQDFARINPFLTNPVWVDFWERETEKKKKNLWLVFCTTSKNVKQRTNPLISAPAAKKISCVKFYPRVSRKKITMWERSKFENC